jgi:hypothetical protein
MKDYTILMADIIGSRTAGQEQLMIEFKALVSTINEENKHRLLSPLTITLGDEFQAVIASVADAVQIVIKLEETLISRNSTYKLRYVIVEGLIETPINKEIAYGMMGDGLTRARKYLENLKKDDGRFFIWLKNQEKKKALNNLFLALQDLTADWNIQRDHQLIMTFLKHRDYKRVAMELKKERSLIWKREKSLKINAYFALKEVANYLTNA